MNLPAAFFAAGIWMIASAIWQTAYRNPRIDAEGRVLIRLGVDLIPGVILAVIVAILA